MAQLNRAIRGTTQWPARRDAVNRERPIVYQESDSPDDVLICSRISGTGAERVKSPNSKGIFRARFSKDILLADSIDAPHNAGAYSGKDSSGNAIVAVEDRHPYGGQCGSSELVIMGVSPGMSDNSPTPIPTPALMALKTAKLDSDVNRISDAIPANCKDWTETSRHTTIGKMHQRYRMPCPDQPGIADPVQFFTPDVFRMLHDPRFRHCDNGHVQ